MTLSLSQDHFTYHRKYRYKANLIDVHHFTNPMLYYLNLLCLLMKLRIFGKIDEILIINKEKHRSIFAIISLEKKL